MPKLNIIFHGTYVFSLMKDGAGQPIGYEVKIPNLPGHVYRAGNWLAEIDLPCDPGGGGPVRMELKGVDPGHGQLDRNRNLIVKRRDPKPGAKPLRATIVLPLPETARTPRTTLREREALSGNDKPEIVKPKFSMGALQVFTYNVPDENGLMMKASTGRWTWEPESGDFINLHMFAAHEHHALGNGTVHEHVKEAFNACMKQSGKDLETEAAIISGGKLDLHHLPQGVLPEETEGLEGRTRRMAQLGRMKRTGRDLNLLWFESEVLDEEEEACEDSGDD